MISRYLNFDPVPWLTDGTDPASTYLTKKEFTDSCDYEAIYHELQGSALTGHFTSLSRKSILGDTANPDLINRGTVWYFLLAVEYGYDLRTDFIRDTAEFISEKFSTPEGGFSLSLKPPLTLACRTGDLVRAFLKSGINDERAASGLKWISAHQRHDGGWLHCPFNGFCDVMKMFLAKKAGSGIRRENDTGVPSCPVATLSCMRALSVSGKPEYKAGIEAGAVYFLKNTVLSAADKMLSCGLNIQPQKCGYPVMSQFDSITALIEIFNTDLWNHPVFAGVFNNIIKRQSPLGTWKLENNSRGMISAAREGNRLVTLNVLRLLKKLEYNESQLEKA